MGIAVIVPQELITTQRHFLAMLAVPIAPLALLQQFAQPVFLGLLWLVLPVEHVPQKLFTTQWLFLAMVAVPIAPLALLQQFAQPVFLNRI
jgi:hypothetical protein